MDDRMSVIKAAKYLGVCEGVVYALCEGKALAHYRVGQPGKRGRIVILKSDCDAYLATHRVEAEGPESVSARKPAKTKTGFRHLTVH